MLLKVEQMVDSIVENVVGIILSVEDLIEHLLYKHAVCYAAVVIYGGETDVYTKSSGGEGLESKTSIDFKGGKHYFKCYDDCVNSSGKVFFNGIVAIVLVSEEDTRGKDRGVEQFLTLAVEDGEGTFTVGVILLFVVIPARVPNEVEIAFQQ